MVRQNRIIVAGPGGALGVDQNLLRSLRGNSWGRLDYRFYLIAFFSIAIHLGLVLYVNRVEIRPPAVMEIERMPERFARLIIEKPIPKTAALKQSGTGTKAGAESQVPDKTTRAEKSSGERSEVERKQAQKAVAVRAAQVEQKVRTVGALGILTGIGTTAKGPKVADVLGAMGTGKERYSDLEAELEKMTGLRKTENIEVLQEKLVRTKEVSIARKENIDDLITMVGVAKTSDLAKKGDFVISKPESIEGAASSNAKRDPAAITSVVSSSRISIRMSYEKYLKRDPQLSGKITIRFTIAATGGVTAIKILENTTGNQEFEQELIRKIRMWTFDQVPEGDVTVTYPFVFTPAAG